MPALSPPLCPGPSHLPSLAGQPPAIAQSPKPARPSPVVVLQACVEGRTQHGPQHSPQSQLLLPPLPPGRPGLAPAPSLPDAHSFLPSSPGPQPPAPGLTSAALPPPPSWSRKWRGFLPHPTRPMLRAEQHPPLHLLNIPHSHLWSPVEVGAALQPVGQFGVQVLPRVSGTVAPAVPSTSASPSSSWQGLWVRWTVPLSQSPPLSASTPSLGKWG